MASNPNQDLLFALRRFIQAVDPKQGDPSMLGDTELSAGREIMSAIDRIVDARVQTALKNALPKSVPAIMADHRQRTP
jgi:hypothetical protein